MARYARRTSFNTQPPEGGWTSLPSNAYLPYLFQHTAARRRLAIFYKRRDNEKKLFQHTAARRRLVLHLYHQCRKLPVSTHSRPKAAGCLCVRRVSLSNCFNTQPPEGGWHIAVQRCCNNVVSTHSRPKAAGLIIIPPFRVYKFQHTAARRRLDLAGWLLDGGNGVSTHSRPKAAGIFKIPRLCRNRVSTHSRPKAAGQILSVAFCDRNVSTHSRPKAAGFKKWTT